MKVGFQCPINGIPCIGEWDEEKGKLEFELEDESYTRKFVPSDEVEECIKWCERNSIKCYSEEQGNNHLDFLGIDERLGVW